jgi:predicted  nucleic acid-binding Zn-ribbon protein
VSTPYDWRIDEIERKAVHANRELYRIDEANRNVDRLEHSLREARSEIDGLRSQLYTCEERIQRLESMIQEQQ